MTFHLSLEGLDGVGKTTTGRLVAERLGFTFLEKPLHLLTDRGTQLTTYLALSQSINALQDPLPRALFYALGHTFAIRAARDASTVTDRHYISTLVNNHHPAVLELLDVLIDTYGVPNMTILLYADGSTRRERIQSRDPQDPDLRTLHTTDFTYALARDFLISRNFPYAEIDTSSITQAHVVDSICAICQRTPYHPA